MGVTLIIASKLIYSLTSSLKRGGDQDGGEVARRLRKGFIWESTNSRIEASYRSPFPVSPSLWRSPPVPSKRYRGSGDRFGHDASVVPRSHGALSSIDPLVKEASINRFPRAPSHKAPKRSRMQTRPLPLLKAEGEPVDVATAMLGRPMVTVALAPPQRPHALDAARVHLRSRKHFHAVPDAFGACTATGGCVDRRGVRENLHSRLDRRQTRRSPSGCSRKSTGTALTSPVRWCLMPRTGCFPTGPRPFPPLFLVGVLGYPSLPSMYTSIHLDLTRQLRQPDGARLAHAMLMPMSA